MTLLPGTNYLSDSARTEAEMKVALDKVNEVIAEIGSKDVTTLTIGASVANGITTPLSSMVSIASEGGAGVADTLATIGVSNIDKGRMVILQHASSAEDESTGITITHGDGAGAIEMRDGANFILCAKRMLGLIYTGATGHWQEVWRGYGRETVAELLAERTAIGLGDASVETIATGGSNASKVLKVSSTPLITNDVLKINASGQIEKALVAELGGGNAATLETHDAASFVRTNETAAQSIDADLTVSSANANLIADGVTTAALRLKANSGANERAFIEMTTSDGELVIGTQTAGGGATVGMKFDPAAGSGGRIVSSVGDIVADIIEANLVSAGDASAGSFRVAAGAYNLLIQWGGDWVDSGSASSTLKKEGDSRLTFGTAYTAAPFIISGGYMTRVREYTGTPPFSAVYGYERVTQDPQPTTITSTYIEIPRGTYFDAGDPSERYDYFRSGNYIAIGTIA